MRIALAVHDFDLTCGHGRYAVELARRLSPSHEVHVFANGFGPAREAAWVYHRVPAFRGTTLTTVLSVAIGIERRLRNGHFHVIHAQGFACFRADVVTAHMCLAAKSKRMRPRGLKAQVFPAVVTPLERRFFHRCGARHLIGVSEAIGREIRHHYGWQGEVHTIYHGTDLIQFRPSASEAERFQLRSRFGLPLESRVWLYMGEAVKGLNDVLEMLPHFGSVHLLIVTRSVISEFERLAVRLGVNDRVHFAGYLLEPELAFRASDAFVYPSPYDPFGMVVAEAMASGLPVVVSDHIGVAEIIEDGRTGFLFQQGDSASLVKALNRLESIPELGRRVGAEARSSLGNYSWDACSVETLRIYEKSLE